MASPVHLLRSVFGYEHFRGLQADIIEQVMQGGDALVLMPTGGGKSLCYQIPAILRPGTGVVISPLIALMQDQVGTLLQLGVKAAFLNSTLGVDDQRAVESRFLAGELDLLYVAPERLLTERTLRLLERSPLSLFAIDEAHCVSQWGHDFRADYWQLSLLHQRFPQVPRIALTATADERTRHEIIERLGLQEARVFCSGFDRPNIRYTVGLKKNPRRQLIEFILREHQGDAGIVYCLSRKKVEETAQWLSEQGLQALPYHAGLPVEIRQRNQQRFLQEDGVIVVATIAFGMGIDKPNVRFVAHLDLPGSIEAYYQETGRAGRDGLPADAWMLYGLQDVITRRGMLDSSQADEMHKRVERHKLDAMLGYCELTSCRRITLLNYFGDRLEQPCGNCDNCLEPVQTWDATEAARKALSCVHRTGQRFGAHYVIDVLLGKTSEKIRSYGHDRLSTFGIGQDLTEAQWLSVFRQLVTQGHLIVDWEAHGALRLAESCRPILRGERCLRLRRDAEAGGKPMRESHRTTPRFSDPADDALFQALRQVRKRLAEEQNVPPYVILHDAVLLEMVRHRPRDHRQLEHIPGIGQRKLTLYGDDFLDAIAEHPKAGGSGPTVAPSTAEESLALFRLGLSVPQIAERRGLKPGTVYGHLAQAIAQGQADVQEVTGLPLEEIARIETLWRSLPRNLRPEATPGFLLPLGEGGEKRRMRERDRPVPGHDLRAMGLGSLSPAPHPQALKPLYEALDGRYDYGILHCLRAAWVSETFAHPNAPPLSD